jgi:ABC-2 type transport system permease protein
MTEYARACWLLFVWQFHRFKRFLPMIIVIQVALAFGIVYGLAFLIPHIDPTTALYLATGAPTITLLVMGMTIVPQEVSQGKLTGRFAYLGALPIPRLATLATDVTFWLLAQIPGTVLALVVAAIRFHFALHIGWGIVPTVFLVAFSGASIGYGLAMLLQPQVANQLTSFMSIGILLFSPINFPMARLPGWLQAVHRVLPVKYMGDLVRWSLTGRFGSSVGLAFAVVAAWCAAGLGTSWVLATRRR